MAEGDNNDDDKMDNETREKPDESLAPSPTQEQDGESALHPTDTHLTKPGTKSLEDVNDDNNHKESEDLALSPTKSQPDHEAALTQTGTQSLEHMVSLPRELAVIAVISLAQFTTQCGLSSVLALTHVIGRHYAIRDAGVLSWLTAGYSLTVGSFILVSGRVGDAVGWKRMMLFGYAWYALWTLVLGCAYYSNHVLFIFARVLQGIGPSIILPNGLALLGALYAPGKRKNMAFALFGGVAPAGGVVGFLMAGLFDLWWWPWLFWIGSICIALIGIVGAFVVPDPQRVKPGVKGKGFFGAIWELDLLGAAVGIAALVLINFAWNQAPSESWSEVYIYVCLIIGILLVPLFFYIEIKVSPAPLLPFDVFTADNAFVLSCLSCGWANFGIWFFYLIQILATVRGIPILLQAAYLSPLVVSGMLAALTSGRLLAFLRPAWVMLAALCCFFTGTALVATLPPHQIYWAQIFVTTVIAPWGMDMSFPSATIIVSNSVAKAHQGTAASLVNTIVNYSISLGLGFAGTVQIYAVPVEKTKPQLLDSYRAALYMGLGLSGLGLVTAVVFLLKGYRRRERKKETGSSPSSSAEDVEARDAK